VSKFVRPLQEVSLFIKLLYLEAVLAMLGVYDEYDPMKESMYIFLFILVGFGWFVFEAINNFSKGDGDAYDTVKSVNYIIISIFFIVTFLLADEPVSEYLKIHPYLTLYPLAGVLNIVWLNSKAVKDWFAK